jgi:diguanylate cyclase (GGDEF)-like protein
MTALDSIFVETRSPTSAQTYSRLLLGGIVSALVLHGVSVGVYFLVGVPFLAGLNLVFLGADVVGMAFLRRGWLPVIEIMAEFVVAGGAAVHILWLGWESGYHYYLLELLLLVLLGFSRPLGFRVAFAASILGILVAMRLVTAAWPPLAVLPSEVLGTMYLTNLCVVVVILALQVSTFSREMAKTATQLRESNDRLNALAYHDPLTGLFNRRALWDHLATEVSRTQRQDRGFVVALGDIDNFKAFNDQVGHDLGDEVLASVARVLQHAIRPTDYAGRWGGEEFLLILTGTGNEEAATLLERLRKAVADQKVTHLGQTYQVTITLGAARWNPSERAETTIARADTLLLKGKRAGKNRVAGP